MPKKTVREMNRLQRIHHSLSARLFRSVLLLAAGLGLAAIAFGFFLYGNAVQNQYKSVSWNIAKTAAAITDRDRAKAYAETVLKAYDACSEELRQDQESSAYRELFSGLEDLDYLMMRQELHKLEIQNDAESIYLAAVDLEHSRQVFVIDSAHSNSYCAPGSWIPLTQEEITAFRGEAQPDLLERYMGNDTSVPAAVTDTERFGYLCTAGQKFYEKDGYLVMFFADTDMNRVAGLSRTFLWQYGLLLLGVTVLLGAGIVLRLKKKVVVPVNRLSEAAASYSADKRKGLRSDGHFATLEIRTGDELEALSLTMQDMERDLSDYVEDLTRITAEKERIGTELSVAGQIQEGMIPNLYPAFPDRSEFDVYATMHPAKEIGGDFYDFFLIDDDHLALVMADVSGKGIPAALFMMASKILISTNALAGRRSPAQILEQVNRQICSNNKAEMFVTVWLGILEIPTGILTAANAGHEYPVIRRAGGSFELIKDRHGFVLGGMDGVRYRDYEIRLEPGDMFFQYTDGVTEATAEGDVLFGTERMLEALNAEETEDPVRVLENLQEQIDRFAAGAPQADDITMLCLRYLGTQAEGEKR